ncbi:hypothetical protein OY671_006538 [Metschnikowia pulcherrima]|nr:hypothetical protein OY671_006538 [Metschnikowia pulcherrima]
MVHFTTLHARRPELREKRSLSQNVSDDMSPTVSADFGEEETMATPKPRSETQYSSSNGESVDEKKNDSPSKSPAKSDPEPQGMTWDDWKKLPMKFIRVYVVIFCMWLGLLSVYWGSLYRREDRVQNMKILVAVEDTEFSLLNSTVANPVIGPMFENLLRANRRLGHFVIANVTELSQVANKRNITLFEELESTVHEHKYWAALHVDANTSAIVYDLLLSGNTSSQDAASVESAITVIYESGRHFSALSQYVTKNVRRIQLDWINNYAPLAYGNMIQAYLTPSQQASLISSANSSTAGASFSYLPSFKLIDYRPARSAAVLGPSELGLIYAQIFSFHQFNFSADLHNSVRERLRFRHFLWYRVLFSQLNHIMLALVYGLMTLAFQVPTDVAFGKSGFLVLWATMYMFISASGGLNECAGTLITFFDKKFLLPPWIISTIVFNISPTFAPFVLSPGFYRYGYAMPMLNAYEALKVIFFDTWKGTLGRNYGILAAWIVLTNIVLCFILSYISRKTRERTLKAAREQSQ